MPDKDSTPPVTPIPQGVKPDELWAALNKITRVVNRSAGDTAKIPDIQKKVDSMGSKVVELSTEMRGMGARVSKIEDKVDKPHDCYQIDVIAEVKDKQRESSSRVRAETVQTAESKARLEAAVADIEDLTGEVELIKAAPRRMFYGLIGVILTILTSVGGLLWFLAELNKDVEFERVQRVEQFQRLERQSANGAKAIRQDIDELSRTVRVSVETDEEFDRMCLGMSSGEKRLLRVTLKRRRKRVPVSCAN